MFNALCLEQLLFRIGMNLKPKNFNFTCVSTIILLPKPGTLLRVKVGSLEICVRTIDVSWDSPGQTETPGHLGGRQ